jgi:hypothetical protein
MTLTLKIGDQPSPIQKELEHVSISITDGNAAALISGITGKKIRIWRLDIYAAVADKTCEFLSDSDSFITVSSAKTLSHEKKSSDGVPVFTCNAGEDFKADPSDTSNWYFYIVYSIE